MNRKFLEWLRKRAGDERGWQAAVCKEFGFDDGFVSRLAGGKRGGDAKLTTLEEMAQKLGITTWALVYCIEVGIVETDLPPNVGRTRHLTVVP